MSVNNSENTRGWNRSAILRLVLEEPGIDRTIIAEETGLTNAAVTRIIQELSSAGLVSETGALRGEGRGRRRAGLQIKSSGGYVLGVSILAYNTAVTLSDLTGNIVASEEVTDVEYSDPKQTLDKIALVANGMMVNTVQTHEKVLGLGAAIAGYLDETGEIWESSPYLGWPKFNIKESLQRRFSMPVTIENVNRTIALAESRIGCCVGVQDILLVRAALGLGGAILSGGKLQTGHRNQAGQIGHIPVHGAEEHCACGRRGCLTTVASGLAILKDVGTDALLSDGLSDIERQGRQLKKLLTKTDNTTETAIDNAGYALGLSCSTVALISASEVVVLTGPLGRNTIYCSAFERGLRAAGCTCDIRTGSEHPILNSAVAAAGLALSKHIYSPSFDIKGLLELQAGVSKAESNMVTI